MNLLYFNPFNTNLVIFYPSMILGGKKGQVSEEGTLASKVMLGDFATLGELPCLVGVLGSQYPVRLIVCLG